MIRGTEGVNKWNNNLLSSKRNKYVQLFLEPGGYREARRKNFLPGGIIHGRPFRIVRTKKHVKLEPESLRRSLGIRNLKIPECGQP